MAAKTRGRRVAGVLGHALGVGVLLALAAWGLGALRPGGVSAGWMSVWVSKVGFEVSAANQTLRRESAGWFLPEAGARILLASGSAWKPTTQQATMTVGTQTGMATIRVRVVHVPMWMVLAALGGGAAGLVWWSRRGVEAGCCERCGYDLRGVRGGRCPECGAEARAGAA